MKKRIYLDNNGSTAVDSKVADAVLQDLLQSTGNPSSLHSYGQESKNRLTKARHTIASYLKVKPQEIIFTSGATEGLNMVIRGLVEKKNKGHIITSDTEHAAVYSTLKLMQERGYEVDFLPCGLHGSVLPDAVQKAIRPDTCLIAIMAVNNETGVKTDVEKIASIAFQANIPFLVDGVALLGKEIFSIPQGVTAMCFSGHKIHAPKGVGFSFIRGNLKTIPIHSGGEQEFGRRGGTENIPAIAGLAEAMRLLQEALPGASERMKQLRDKLEQALLRNLPGTTVNGLGPRVVNTTNLAFRDVEGETLITALDMEGVAVTHGSACASGALEPSRVLLNMGIPVAAARASLRFSLSRYTTEEEIDTAIEVVTRVVKRLQGLN